MHATIWKRRFPALLVVSGLILLLFGLSATTPTSDAAEWESDEHKVILRIPDAPSPWKWLPAGNTWGKYGIIRGATREIEKLKDGSKPNGEHGLVHLIVRDAEEGATAASLAEDDDVREMLMARFGDSPSDWPEVESNATELVNDVPAVILSTKGKATNPKVGKPTLCTAIMIVAVANSKAYYLRMYAWHTEYDDEQLELDLGMIETDYEIIPETKKPAEEAPPPPEEGGPEDPVEDEGEDEEIQLREYQLRLTRHKKLKLGEPDEAGGLILKLEDSDALGYYSVYLYATKNGRIIDGQVAPPEDIKKWITTDWWKNFTANHPEGELYTFKWPKIKAPTFLTVPDLSEDNQKHIAGGRKKTPVEPKASDMMKKMKCVEKVKKNLIGEKYKVQEPFRGVLKGNRPRRGKEVMIRFAWRTVNHSYRMFVLIGGQADVKWGDAIRETLHSMHFYKD